MPRKTAPPSEKTGGQQYVPSDVNEMEQLALSKANRCISAIENALAVWELSKEKPSDLAERINRLKYFYEALTNWEKKTLKTIGKGEELDSRVKRLKEFTDICYTYT